ncbi:uncharacterized protein [Centruroides vittatus]|uniref:uncharacterized protein n=1 Tax=Centruroides vittatus TaxID=120091 RepID=UPI00350F14B7
MSNTKLLKTPAKTTKVLLLYNSNEDKSCNNLRKIIFGKIKPSSLNIGVKKIRNIGGGDVAIELKKEEDARKLQDYIENSIPEVNVKRPKKRQPNVVIYSVPTQINRGKLTQLMYNQNDAISDNYTLEAFREVFNVKFAMGKKSNAYTNWVIQVTPLLRKQLLMAGKVNLEWSRCRIADFCPVLQCFRCCRFGHSTKNCSQPTATCSHCSGEHTFRECTQKNEKPTCTNCKLEKSGDTNHNARDGSCTIYQKIKSNLIRQTDYGS